MTNFENNLILQAARDGELLIYGHRGAMAYAPMNTIAAYELAAEQGAQGIELDVHRSKDGYPVIVHDFSVDATTDGTGTVSQMTLAQLKALDAGSWFDESFAGLRIPTLDEVFEAVGQRLLINIEIKSITPETDGVEQVVADCIARHNMADRVLVSCFNPPALKRFAAIMPQVPIGFLYANFIPMDTPSLMKDIPHQAYHPYFQMIDADLVAEAKAANRIVNSWTVNEADEAKRLQSLGVEGIITNNPDTILSALSE